jgi:Tfp pilus assembly protein PilV
VVGSQGFSLLETVIALLIMMIVTLGTAQLYVYATHYNAGSADRAASLALAQQKMERMRRASFSDADLTAGVTTQAITYNSHNYSMTTTVCASSTCGGSDTLKIITVQVTPQSADTWANVPITLISQRASQVIGPYCSN